MPMSRRAIRRRVIPRRRGMTLVEVLLAVTLLVLLMGAAVSLFRVQLRALGQSAGRMDALQNARYAQNTIDRELRVSGIGTPDVQPVLVQAGRFAITFNGDLVTHDSSDVRAVYYDPSTDSAAVVSLTPANAIVLPLSSAHYPDTTYMDGPMTSRAETISYWAEVDSAAERADQYILYRRVNDADPTVVTKGIIIPEGHSLFTYYTPAAGGGLDSIPTAQLPLFHTPKIHTAADSLLPIDAIRVVRMHVEGVYRDRRSGEYITRRIESATKLLNAGLLQRNTCGDPPAPPENVEAKLKKSGGKPDKVEIKWKPSLDQDAGEVDVERYAIFKRSLTSPDWGEPFTSVGASQSSYNVDDGRLAGGIWQYAVMAQDCSAQNSPLEVAGNTVFIP